MGGGGQVRFRELCGLILLSLSFSHFDPKRTSGLGLHPSENEVLFRYSTIHIEHLFISPAC